jgi:hypothetical protein
MPRRTITAVLLIWTAGVSAVWLSAGVLLNVGVDEADIQECAAEGFIPPEECEHALEMLEADDPAPITVGVPLIVWFAGSLLIIWAMTRLKSADSD